MLDWFERAYWLHVELIVACGTERNFTEFALKMRLHFVSFRGPPVSFDECTECTFAFFPLHGQKYAVLDPQQFWFTASGERLFLFL